MDRIANELPGKRPCSPSIASRRPPLSWPALPPPPCPPARNRSRALRQGQVRGRLRVLCRRSDRAWEAKAKKFEQRYPGIKISITGGFSNVLDKQHRPADQGGKLEVDVAIFQTLQDFVRWKAEGRLLAYKPVGFDAIDASFKDADGALLRHASDRDAIHVQHPAGERRRDAELRARFSQADVHRQERHALSGGRRRHALAVLQDGAEVRLGLDGQVHGQQAELHPGPSRPAAQHRLRPELPSRSTRSSTSPSR